MPVSVKGGELRLGTSFATYKLFGSLTGLGTNRRSWSSVSASPKPDPELQQEAHG
ncbi:hypothetical protein J6590_001373 [Homalodisca vitripennis]|nr:hypothetical protein J6590_001373 [Homalodisca vitripennis]